MSTPFSKKEPPIRFYAAGWHVEGGPLDGRSYEFYDDVRSELHDRGMSCDLDAARSSGSAPVVDRAGATIGLVRYVGSP